MHKPVILGSGEHLKVQIADNGTGGALTRYMEQLSLAWLWAWAYLFVVPFQWMTDAFFCAPFPESLAPVANNGCMWTPDFFDVNWNYFVYMLAQAFYLPANPLLLGLTIILFIFQ